MSTANRVIKNTGFLYAKMGITMFISLYITRLVLNALGASDFGIFNVVGGAIAMLGFLHSAMSSATQRFMSFYEGKGDKEKQKYIFNVSTVLHFGIAILLGIILLVAGYFFFNGILNIPDDRIFAAKVIYGSLILSTMFTVLSVPYEAVLNAHENMLYYSIVGVVESLLKLAVALIIVTYAGDKLVLYGILMAAIPFVSRTIMQIYCHRKYTECVISPFQYFEKDLMKEMTSFAGWSFLSSVSSIVTMQGISLVLNAFFGVIANAAHAIANQLSGQIMVFSNNMLKALNPVIVKSEGANNRKRMITLSLIGNKVSFIFLLLFAVPFIVEMPIILDLWLKNLPEYSVIFCRIILVQLLLSQTAVTLPTAISSTGNIKQYSIVSALIWMLPIPFGILVYSLNGPIYSIYLLIILMVILRIIANLYFANKLCQLNVRHFIKDVFLKCFLSFVVATSINYYATYLFENIYKQLIASFLINIISVSMLFYFILLNKKEKEMFISLLYMIKTKLFKK